MRCYWEHSRGTSYENMIGTKEFFLKIPFSHTPSPFPHSPPKRKKIGPPLEASPRILGMCLTLPCVDPYSTKIHKLYHTLNSTQQFYLEHALPLYHSAYQNDYYHQLGLFHPINGKMPLLRVNQLGLLRIFFIRGRIFTKAQATYPRPGEYSHGLGQESLRFF